MRGRVWWFAIGVGLTVVLVWKGREWYQRFTPQGVADQLHATRESLGVRASGFVTTFREAMTEREAEIREALEAN